ncbi:MAG: AAA family ATPase [Bacillota bacterium]|nr:AAA family ATPase [Bacillota bacterium]
MAEVLAMRTDGNGTAGGFKPTGDPVRDYYLDLFENQGVKQQDIARAVGYSHTAVSLFVRRGRGSARLRAELERHMLQMQAEGSESAPTEDKPTGYRTDVPDFLATEDARQVLGLCDLCATEKEIGVVAGSPGSGKTTAIKEYCRRDPEAVYITAEPTITAKELLVEIGRALAVDINYCTMHEMLRKIVAHLRETPRLIIVDEADTLVTYTVKKLEILRAIHDQAKVGIVLVGMPRLIALLLRGPSLKENLAQLYSRVGYVVQTKGFTADEARALLDQYNVTEGARQELLKRADQRQGGMRRFIKVLRRCLDLVGDGQITKDVVLEADGLLLSLGK